MAWQREEKRGWDQSAIKVCAVPAGRSPGPAEVFAKGEGILEKVAKETDNEISPWDKLKQRSLQCVNTNLHMTRFLRHRWISHWRVSARGDTKKQEEERSVLWRKDLRPVDQLSFRFGPQGQNSWLFAVGWKSVHASDSVILEYSVHQSRCYF